MIEQIITSIVCIILATILGFSIGNTDYHTLQRKNNKLELQNQVLKREYDKLHYFFQEFKDKRNDVLVDDQRIIIYCPLEEDDFFEKIRE